MEREEQDYHNDSSSYQLLPLALFTEPSETQSHHGTVSDVPGRAVQSLEKNGELQSKRITTDHKLT